MHKVSIEIFDAYTGNKRIFTGDELDVRLELREEHPYLEYYPELETLEDDLHFLSRSQGEFITILEW